MVQSINPWTSIMSGSQFGLVNVTLGQSSQPAIEAEVLSDVGTYGKQLGHIGDAMSVLLDHVHPDRALTATEAEAIAALKTMLAQIDKAKRKHHGGSTRS